MLKQLISIGIPLFFIFTVSATELPFSGVVFSVSKDEVELLVDDGVSSKKGLLVELITRPDVDSDREVSLGKWKIIRLDMNAVFIAHVDNDFTVPKTGASVMVVKPRTKIPPKPAKQSVIVPRKQPLEHANERTETPSDNRNNQIPPPTSKPPNNTHSGQTAVVTKKPNNTHATIKSTLEKSIVKQLKITQEEKDLIDDLNSRNSGRVRAVARHIFLKKCKSKVVINQAALVLASKYNRFSWDGLHIDAMAWICKALMVTGDAKYMVLLKEVETNAKAAKLRKYAQRCRHELKRKTRESAR